MKSHRLAALLVAHPDQEVLAFDPEIGAMSPVTGFVSGNPYNNEIAIDLCTDDLDAGEDD